MPHRMCSLTRSFAAAVFVGGALVSVSQAAELPKATKDTLATLKMDPSVLKGLDQELDVPASWIERAKKEPPIIFYGGFLPAIMPDLLASFKARYPFISFNYTRASRTGRVDKPLIAFREGRVLADIIDALGGAIQPYRKMGALTDLRDLPNFKNTHPGMRAKDGLWVGQKVKYWCMSYNSNLIKKKDLPKSWEDMLTTTALYKGNIGISNRPHNWILPLWTTNGEAWTRNFISSLFTTVRPQLRKEGARALVVLNIAGEFHAAIPATDYRIAEYAAKGAPIKWHCPEPVPMTVSTLVIIKGTKALYSSKVFLNWFLSKEGQLAQYAVAGGSPVHKDLQDKGLVKYGKEIEGKKIAVRTPESLVSVFPTVLKTWNNGWVRAGGPMAAKTVTKVKTVLTAIKRGGRRLSFKVGGGEHKVKVSGSRTEVMIGGKSSSRGKLKVGMDCEIAYLGNGNEARKIACK